MYVKRNSSLLFTELNYWSGRFSKTYIQVISQISQNFVREWIRIRLERVCDIKHRKSILRISRITFFHWRCSNIKFSSNVTVTFNSTPTRTNFTCLLSISLKQFAYFFCSFIRHDYTYCYKTYPDGLQSMYF